MAFDLGEELSEKDRVLQKISKEINDPSFSDLLDASENAKGYSIKAKGKLVVRVTKMKSKTTMEIPTRYIKYFPGTEKTDDEFVKIIINGVEDVLDYSNALGQIAVQILSVTAGRMFGCCSYFNECSDAGECVLKNKMQGLCCEYKRHLDKGEIFYGKHPNFVVK